MTIDVIVADVDGTLITKGDFTSVPNELISEIRNARKKGVLFSFASGRDRVTQNRLRKQIFEEEPKAYEAILYEDAGLILGNGTNYVLEGLPTEVLQRIDTIYSQSPEIFGRLVPLPNGEFTLRRAFVTREFAEGLGTNKEDLERSYGIIKEGLRQKFDGVKIVKSADAVDILSEGSCKSLALEKYAQILGKKCGIPPEKILVIGDAANDVGMLERILELGGKAAFVGEDKEIQNRVRQAGAYISNEQGPVGTLEAIRFYRV